MSAKESHPLLEDKALPYSHATVRRAFIIWLHFGQTTNFKSVCTFYHRLEQMEMSLPPNERAARRRREISLYSRTCPNCEYSSAPMEQYRRLADISTAATGHYDHPTLGVTNEIIDTSKLVRKYCQARCISLKRFHDDFISFTRVSRLRDTVGNVTLYIKRKVVLEELLMVEDYVKNFGLVNLNADHTQHCSYKCDDGPKMLEQRPYYPAKVVVSNGFGYWNDLTHDSSLFNPARIW